MKKILVCAAHPDDEVLGCGGSIAKWTSQGHHVEVIIAAEGLASRADSGTKIPQDELEQLKETARAANKILGVKAVHFLSFPDNRMDNLNLLDIVKPIEKIINMLKPEVVVTHHPGDVNIDHKLLFEAVITATRPIPNMSVRTVLCFEVASSTGWFSNLNAIPFNPTYFISIENTWDLKKQALNVYSGEMRDFPHARSIENLHFMAQNRGASVGLKAAEAFQVCRIIEN